MTRLPIQIKDRVATGDDIFQTQTLPEGKIRLVPQPSSIYEEGTDVNAELMQPWEDLHAAVTTGEDVQLKMLWNGRVVRITNRGTYSGTAVYRKYDYVISAEGNGFVAKRDMLTGAGLPSTLDGNDEWSAMLW